MKKLMIALSIVAMAMGLTAANVEWKLSANSIKYKDGKTTATTSGNHGAMTFYLFEVSSADGFSDTFKAALKDGSINAGNMSEQSGYINTYQTGTTGAAIGGHAQDTAVVPGAGEAENHYLAWIAFDTISGASDNTTYFYASDAKTATGWTTGSDVYTKGGATVPTWTSTGYSASNWTKVESVPEPTSAMLLLLGVAGLALRRRRA